MPHRILILVTIAIAAQTVWPNVHIDRGNLDWIEDAPLKLLEKRQELIHSELGELAEFNFHNGVGAICYRSMPTHDSHSPEWVQIDFDQSYLIEEIVLVPTIWHVNGKGYQDDGFPRAFRVLGGSAGQERGSLIAEIKSDNSILPRVAPLIIPDVNLTLDWIRVEATELSTRAHDRNYILQFSEVMAFTAHENVALDQATKTSSEQKGGSIGNYRKENLVDGFTPYLMDAARGEKSNPYITRPSDIGEFVMRFDLSAPRRLTGLRVHTIEQGDTIPHGLQPDFGLPQRMLVEGANQSNFSDATTLWDYQRKGLYDVAPIISKRIPPSQYRYLRLTAVEPYLYEGVDNLGNHLVASRLGLAEVEAYSENENVLLGRIPEVGWTQIDTQDSRSLSSLTDGYNIFGEILTFREWMKQLAQRHELEYELPLIVAAINHRYDRQKTILASLIWISSGLAVLAVIIILTDRILRQRAIFRTRERIAADLHDELGANLHAISLLGDLAMAKNARNENMASLIERIRNLAQRTSTALKYCTNMLDTPGLYQDLPLELRQIAKRLMTDLDHQLEIVGEEKLENLKPSRRIDFFLFYKECLTNILRHSHATRIQTRIEATEQELILSVLDNGHGAPNNSPNWKPNSLKRRARLLRAKLTSSKSPLGGVSITLKLRF